MILIMFIGKYGWGGGGVATGKGYGPGFLLYSFFSFSFFLFSLSLSFLTFISFSPIFPPPSSPNSLSFASHMRYRACFLASLRIRGALARSLALVARRPPYSPLRCPSRSVRLSLRSASRSASLLAVLLASRRPHRRCASSGRFRLTPRRPHRQRRTVRQLGSGGLSRLAVWCQLGSTRIQPPGRAAAMRMHRTLSGLHLPMTGARSRELDRFRQDFPLPPHEALTCNTGHRLSAVPAPSGPSAQIEYPDTMECVPRAKPFPLGKTSSSPSPRRAHRTATHHRDVHHLLRSSPPAHFFLNLYLPISTHKTKTCLIRKLSVMCPL